MIVAKIFMDCPEMKTERVSWWERKTTEITCPTKVCLPSGEIIIEDDVVFPVCSIKKKLGLLWQVDEVTATGKIVEVTLRPEWTFGPGALPCKATGHLLDRPGSIAMRFPFAWSKHTGPGEWTVAEVFASGTVMI